MIYGAFQDPRAVSLNPKDILRIIHSKTGHNSIFDVEIAGVEKTPVIVADEQYHPVKGTLMHIDLKRIDLTRKLRVSVPVHVTGEAERRQTAGRRARRRHTSASKSNAFRTTFRTNSTSMSRN